MAISETITSSLQSAITIVHVQKEKAWADLGILGKGGKREAGARAKGGRYCDVGVFRLLLFEWSFSGAAPITDKNCHAYEAQSIYNVK